MLDKEIDFTDMQPGDLIFLSATYSSKFSRPFQHSIVHVEIYTGNGINESTIGARW